MAGMADARARARGRGPTRLRRSAGPAGPARPGRNPRCARTPAPQGTARPQGRIPSRWRWAGLALLTATFLAIGLHQAGRDAPSIDEGVDLSSGVTTLVRHDLRLIPEHPPLPKVLAALPALLAHPKVPGGAAYREGRWFDASDDFIAANEAAGRLRPMLVWARAVVLFEAVGCAGLLYVLGARAFGPDGGALAAAAWLTTPYVVGFGHLAMIDVPFTLVVLLTAVLLARWRDAPSLRRAAELGLVLGLGLACRHTALVVLAVAVAVVFHGRRHEARDAARHVAVLAAVAVVVVWAVYRGLDPSGPSGAVAARFDGIVATSADGSVVSRLVTALPLPREWRAGFAYLDLTSVPRPASLLGRSWDGGRWWYFPVSAAVKLPATLVAAVVAGWAIALRRRFHRPAGVVTVRAADAAPDTETVRVTDAAPDAGTDADDVRDADVGMGATARPGAAVPGDRTAGVMPVIAGAGDGLAVVGLLGVALWLFLVAQPLDLGLRLALPSVALAYVGLGALLPLRHGVDASEPVGPGEPKGATRARPGVHSGRGRATVALFAIALVGVGQMAALAASVPHSLAWTPPPWSPAYRWVSDANLDAGQGLYELRAWARDREHPLVAYDATRGLSVGGGSRSLSAVPPGAVRGWVAVGATPLMQTRREPLAWLRAYCPVGTLAGGSILVYRFTSAPDPMPGPERPVPPCRDAARSTRR